MAKSGKPFLILLVVALVATLGWLLRPAAAVEAVQAQQREVVELVIASGRLRAVRQSPVGTSVAGTVAKVLVVEGDQVRKGQLLIQLDDGDIRAQVDQARHAVETAASEVARVERGAQPEEIGRARAQLDQASLVNRARVVQASQRLEQLRTGGRVEERRQAEANLAKARADREQAQRDLARAQMLLKEGAMARSTYEQAATSLERARANEESLAQQLLLARQPARAEEIAAAQAELRAAQATDTTGAQVARASLGLLQRMPYPEDRDLVRAKLAEARAALRNAERQADKRLIRAPMAGLITRRSVEPGQGVTTGNSLLTLADMSSTEIYVETDETNLPRLKVGQSATVYPPAFRDRPFTARLTQIGPDVDAIRGVVPLRLKPDRLPDYARPDMTLDINVEVNRIKALSIPLSCLITQSQDYSFLIDGGRVKKVPVKVLARGQNWAAVEGIPQGQPVVVHATEVREGQRARARTVEMPPLESGPPPAGANPNGKAQVEPVGE